MKSAITALKNMGFELATEPRHKNANGPDLWVIRDKRMFTVEVKKATSHKTKKVLRVHPVEKLRTRDDLIAIICPSGYVLIEPMSDHLSACSKSGYRSLGALQ